MIYILLKDSSNVGVLNYNKNQMIASLLNQKPSFYQLIPQNIQDLSTIDKNLMVKHSDFEISFLSNTFTSQIATAAAEGTKIKKEADSDSGFNLENIRYFIMPGAILCVYVYQVYFKKSPAI